MDDKTLLEIMRNRFDLCVESENDIRKEALDDLQFRSGDQWPANVRQQRELEKRPCLTINRLPQFTRQIVNDQRQNRPAIEVTPVDDNGDPQTAEVYLGLIRHIEHSSNADVAYDTAFASAVNHGFGYFRIITEYCSHASFDQTIRFKRVPNPFCVYLDPAHTEPDGSDASYGFIFENVSEDDYKVQWPNSELSQAENWTGIGDDIPDWVRKDGVRVVEYFYVEKVSKRLALLNTGDMALLADNAVLPEGVQVIQERPTEVPKIHWIKSNGHEVLERTEWLGRWIPIIPVYGDELIVDGHRILEGVIRHAKDPQRMYNYWATAETEMIALAPKAPFIMAEGQAEGYEEQWKSANVRAHAFLTYKPKALNGEVLPPPQRNTYEPPVVAITNARAQSSDDLKATTGIYDASLGARSNERSGKAILAREAQAETSNFHFIDNLGRSIRHAGRILVDLIPKVFSPQGVVRIIGDDGAATVLNLALSGIDLSVGHYDVIIRSGPSYATKRQQAVESMLELTRAYPELVKVAGDLIVKNMDWAGARELAERIRKTLPPGLADVKPGQRKGLPPQVIEEIDNMQRMIEQLTQAVQQAEQQLADKQAAFENEQAVAQIKASADVEAAKIRAKTDMQITLEKLQTELAIAKAKLQSEEAQALLKHSSEPAQPKGASNVQE